MATTSTVRLAGQLRHYLEDPYVALRAERAPLRDDVDVAVIGGGFGGLMTAARLERGRHHDVRHHRPAAISAAPGTGTATPARSATSSRTSTCRCSKKRAHAEGEVRACRPRSSSTASASASTSACTTTRCFQTRVTEVTWETRRWRWVSTTTATTSFTRAVRHQATGPLPGRSCRAFRASRLQRPHVPHVPLGLRLHRRRSRRRPLDELARQARRRSSAPVRRRFSACRSSATRAAAVRVPAHAVVGGPARQQTDRPSGSTAPGAGLAAGGWRTSPRSHGQNFGDRTSSRTVGPTSRGASRHFVDESRQDSRDLDMERHAASPKSPTFRR